MSPETPPPAASDGSRTRQALIADALAADAAFAAAEAWRTRAYAALGQYGLDAAAGDRPTKRASDMALREIASELAAAQRLSDRTVQAHIGRAMQIVDDLPVTLAAWGSGALTRAHVRAIADVVSTLPEERSAEFDAIAASLGLQLSPGRLRARLAAVAEKLQPTTLSERHRRGRETRCVRIVTGVDGMSDLIATLPTVLAVGIYDRLTQQSRALIDAREQGAGAVSCGSDGGSGGGAGAVGADGADSTAEGIPGDDERTTDQIRADILADLLLTTAPSLDPTRADDGAGGLGAIRARVQLVVPALSVLRAEDENLDPAELVGHGPIDIDTARRLAEATVVAWDRVLTHPVTGEVLSTDTYHRTAAIDRHLRARDRRCRWPGCAVPAIRCEVDHTREWARGDRTEVANLGHLCQRHHSQKQFTRWSVRQRAGGVLEWTSPSGRMYADEPLPYSPAVRFLPDESPPPGSEPIPF
jgi:hypothetical protein